ncbi:MAG: YtxH domain-containing protein [Bergeyella sp.]|nr:YtxH domain-containing protein [Bergeyella sp.]
MSKKGKGTSQLLAGLVTGVLAGLVVGLLYAPEDGKSTRKKIKSKASDLADQAVDAYDKTASMVKDKYEELSSKVKDTSDKVATSLNKGYHKYKDQTAKAIAEVSKEIEAEFKKGKS